MADESVPAPATPEAATAAPEAASPVVSAPTIPEKYEFKLDEGRTLDAGLIDAVSPLFKEFNLTQESAAKLVSAYDKYAQTFEANEKKAMDEYFAKVDKDNVQAMKNEWGQKYSENLTIAQSAIARFLGDAAKKKLDDSGLGNDPDFMKGFYQAGLMIKEDKPPVDVTPAPRKASTLFTKSLGAH